MTKLSEKQTAIARKNERLILRSLAEVTQKSLAETLGVSESKISRMKDGDLEELCVILAVLNLQIVPTESHVVTPCEYKFMAQQMVAHYQKVLDEM